MSRILGSVNDTISYHKCTNCDVISVNAVQRTLQTANVTYKIDAIILYYLGMDLFLMVQCLQFVIITDSMHVTE